MSLITRYACKELEGVEISCIVVKGEPWFKGSEVAMALGYKYPSDAVCYHVPLKFKNKLTFLLKASENVKKTFLDVSELNTNWISEAGLFKLVFKSRAKHAEVFQDWVCSEVLPSIRKTGRYDSTYPYRRDNITKDEVEQFANVREDRLHYDVVKHVKARYPDAILQPGLGEHLTTSHARMDAASKGYASGHPDLMILRGLPNAFHDVLAIELKSRNGKARLRDNQIDYHRKLKENCNVETIVGCNYDDIVIAIHEHYKDVFGRAHNPAITDQPKTFNFAENENPKYWCKKLQNGPALLEQCRLRGIPKNEIMVKTNQEIASVLITFDRGVSNPSS